MPAGVEGSFNSRTPGGVRLDRSRISLTSSRFQFTHPGRGATGYRPRTPLVRHLFQFTHPGRGATCPHYTGYRSSSVSIHAPREGCDLRDTAKLRSRYCFNSRTPGGVRQTSTLPDPLRGMFQFTHPGRGATIHKLEAYLRGAFQFTHPGRGATTE